MPTGLSSISGLVGVGGSAKLSSSDVRIIEGALAPHMAGPPSLTAEQADKIAAAFLAAKRATRLREGWAPARPVNQLLQKLEQVSAEFKKTIGALAHSSAQRDRDSIRSTALVLFERELERAGASISDANQITAIAKVCELAAAHAIRENPDVSTKGRNSLYDAQTPLICALADLFHAQTGRRPTSVASRKTGETGGAFVAFVGVVLASRLARGIDPIASPYLGRVCKAALATWRRERA